MLGVFIEIHDSTTLETSSKVAEASSRCAQLRADLAALAARQETRHAETSDLREQATAQPRAERKSSDEETL